MAAATAAAAAATYSLANPGCPLRELSRALDDHSETGMGTQGLRPCTEALSEGLALRGSQGYFTQIQRKCLNDEASSDWLRPSVLRTMAATTAAPEAVSLAGVPAEVPQRPRASRPPPPSTSPTS